MRVGIFSECYKPTKNGVVVSIETFRQEFEKQGHAVFIFAPLTPGYKDDNHRVLRFQSFRVPGHGYYPIGVPFSPSIYRHIKKLKLDIVHVQGLFSISNYGRRAARKLKIPVIMTYHSPIEEFSIYSPILQSLVRKYLANHSRRFANLVDHVVTPSSPMKDILENKYHITTPISVIPTGIEVDKFPDITASQVRKKYLIAPNKKILFYGGRIAREKNLGLLFDSFFELRKKIPVHLIIAGSGPEEEHFKKYAAKLNLLDDITFTGYLEREQINWLFAGADVFAMPSAVEAQGIVVLEAFAGHTPVVAVDKMGPSKIVIDGQNGYLTKNSTEDFTNKIYKILKNNHLRNNMAQAARARAQEFSADKMASRMLDLYKLVIHQQKN